MKNALPGKCVNVIAAGIAVYGISTAVFAGNENTEERERGEMNERRFKTMKHKNMRGDNFNQNRARGKMGMLLSRLSEEERKELAELRKTDKEAFRDKIKELVKKYKKQWERERKKVKALAKKIRNATSEDEKEKLKDELRTLLSKQFDAKMVVNRKNYEQAEKRLKELKKRLDARESKAAEIIERKLQEMTEDPDLKW
ncbi:MAG: hypothetical protein GXP32_07025 [Kiritimatiellaeota bacterium]|nr:hypothetical protein [Kiritimatiellota bacterium]